MTKTELMQMVGAGQCKESFTFVPSDGSPEREYDITTLRKFIKERRVKWELVPIELSCLVPFLLTNRVWEQDRVNDLTPTSYELDPPIALREPDGSVILADGVHRIMRLHQQNCREVRIVFVDEHDAPRVGAGWGKLPEHDWGVSLESLSKKN